MRRQRSLMVLAAACAGVIASVPNQGRAATVTWDNGAATGIWSDNGNWNPDGAVEANDARFNASTAVAVAGQVTNTVDAHTSVLSLAYTHGALAGGNTEHTTQINSGITLTVNGTSGSVGTALYVGTNNDNLAVANITNVRFVGAGTLRIDNAAADFQVRQTSSNTAGPQNPPHRMTHLDMSGLGNFDANVRNFRVGVGDPTTAMYNRAIGWLTLANNNVINANTIEVGHNPNNGTTHNTASRLFFGQSNVVNTNSILIGGHTTSNNASGFRTGISGGTLQIRGAGGVGRADFLVGAQLVGVASATSATNNIVDFTGATGGMGSGSIDALLGNVVLGRAGNTAGATVRNGAGTLTYNAGSIDANDVILGDDNNTPNAGIGTGILNVQGSGTLVVNNTMTLGRKQNAGASGAVGTLNVSGPTASARIAGPVTDGGGSSTINVNSGARFQAESLGTSAARIDALNLDNATLVVDVSGGVPAGAWGYVNAFTPTGANTMGLNFAPGTLSAGQVIQAISYSSLGGGGFGSFTMGKLPARVTAHLADGAATSTIDIVIDGADSPKWNGTVGSAEWDINTTSNWQLITAGTPTTYLEDLVTYSTTDSVLFNDDAANTSVNLTTTVAPNAINVNNPTKNYTFGGAGKITGATGVLKQGAGTLTIANTGGNDFSGPIDVQAGTLATGADQVLPDSGTVAVSGGTFALGDNDETTGLVSVAAGNVTLNNGALTVGTLGVSGGGVTIAGSGSISANIMNHSGGTISLGTGSLSATTMNLSNGVTLNPATGSITVSTVNIDNATVGAGPLTAANVNFTSSGTVNADIGGGAIVSKIGDGTATLAGNSTYTGGTRLENGNLLITHDNALGSTSGTTFIENGGNDGAGSLQLSGNINTPEGITLSGRRGPTVANPTNPSNENPHILNVSGNNTISGNITLFTGGTNHNIGSAAGKLTISGNIINNISATQTRYMHLRGAGDGEISGNIQVTGTDPQDIIKSDAGTWTISGTANSKIQKTTVRGGTLAFAGPSYLTGTLDAQAGTRVEVPGGAGYNRVVRPDTLVLAADAVMDLGDNKLLTNTAVGTWDGSKYTGIQGEVARAYDFGAWDLPGIMTSEPDAGPAVGKATIGVATGEQALFLGPTDTGLFGGQTINGTTTIAMYTWAGDVDLNGYVDAVDYGTIDQWIQFPGTTGYTNGDLNYDGVIDAVDYGIIDNGIQLQGAPIPINPPSPAATASLSGVTAVPEPSACGFAILAAASLVRRRRRQRRP